MYRYIKNVKIVKRSYRYYKRDLKKNQVELLEVKIKSVKHKIQLSY